MSEKIWTAKEIQEKINSSDRWRLRAAVAIYKQQTALERAAGVAKSLNGVGFNRYDSRVLSPICAKIVRKQPLSKSEMGDLRRRIKKYATQLAKIANKEL